MVEVVFILYCGYIFYLALGWSFRGFYLGEERRGMENWPFARAIEKM